MTQQYNQETLFNVADLNLTEQKPLAWINSYRNTHSTASRNAQSTIKLQTTRPVKVEDRLCQYKQNYNKNIVLKKHQLHNKELSTLRKPSINAVSQCLVQNMNVNSFNHLREQPKSKIAS
eukprot:TRINITY_DN4681_c0_g1_i1.p1 TRINITY_DN4681_c0_g1~~TRINITY_DN4681_c0_g1_i1.p1  ORF type:complete len:120 (+),score=22.57 TRINITY_DN4681_c0_g1_i1:71-430(+)